MRINGMFGYSDDPFLISDFGLYVTGFFTDEGPRFSLIKNGESPLFSYPMLTEEQLKQKIRVLKRKEKLKKIQTFIYNT